MIKSRFILAGLFTAFVGLADVSAQDIVARVPGLESNKDYMNLLRSDDNLRQKTDSLLAVIRNLRVEMRSDSEQRDSLSQVRLDSMRIVLSDAENAIYNMRTQKMKLIDKINAIEQQHVLSSMGNIGNADGVKSSGSIFSNEYFKKSIEPEDFKTLMAMQGKEATVRDYAQTYTKNYSKIKSLYDKYLLVTTEAEAEELYRQMATVMDENMVLERRLSKMWTEIYDQKIYVYSYFLEKESREDILEITESMIMESRQQKLLSVDNCVSEPIMDYCLQKPIILNYEMYVAKLLNITPAIDSLSNASRVVRQIDYRMPVVDVERRSFVDYQPIEFVARTPYNSSNPIPECVVYEYGVVYRILLGTYKYKQSASIFRNATPLFVEQLEDGRFSYYAGGLHNKAEAEAALEVMKKKGFRNPQIVEWFDGRKTNLSEVGEGEAITYRLAIKGGELDDTVRDVIATMAADCQISKSGEGVFILAPFVNRALAERVAQAVGKCDENLTVEIIEVKPEPQPEEEE